MGELVLDVRSASYRYGPGELAVADASFSVQPRMSIGIVGESGSGKSTLARLLAGVIAPTAGQVTVNERAWSHVRRGDDLRRQVQMIFQDPYAALNPYLSVVSTVTEAVQVCRALPRRDARSAAIELLQSVGIGSDLSSARPRRLSGGQCQRVSIARALAASPAVIIADEPTSALDVSVQAQILNLLLSLRASSDMSLVLVSHDLSVISHLTDHVIVMYQGRIVEQGRTFEVIANPSHPYTRRLMAARPGAAIPAPRLGEVATVLKDRANESGSVI
jgi:ABC-type glutathione transport system ATPase component